MPIQCDQVVDAVKCGRRVGSRGSALQIFKRGANKLLFGLNPRSGKADHMLNKTRCVTYSSWLPENAIRKPTRDHAPAKLKPAGLRTVYSEQADYERDPAGIRGVSGE